VIDTKLTLQLGLGHICDAEGSGGGPIEALAVIWPLLGGINVVWPCKGPKDARWGGGLLPPGFTHCKTAVPPDDDRNAPETTLPSPATLKTVVRLALGFFVIVGVPIKCALAANAREGAAIMANASNVVAADKVIV
jgi:hypothetical protein